MKKRRIPLLRILIILIYGFIDAVDITCPRGFFVVNGHCSGICHCLKNDTCDAANGRCWLGSCADGYTGISCQEVQALRLPRNAKPRKDAPEKQINNTCTPKCEKQQQCHSNGTCIALLGKGCPDTKFGPRCLQTCHCFQNADCDKKTGACDVGCADGWKGSSCQEKTNNTMMIIAGAAVAMVVALVFAAGFYIYKRKTRSLNNPSGSAESSRRPPKSKHSSDHVLFRITVNDLPTAPDEDVTTSGVCRTKNYYMDLKPVGEQETIREEDSTLKDESKPTTKRGKKSKAKPPVSSKRSLNRRLSNQPR